MLKGVLVGHPICFSSTGSLDQDPMVCVGLLVRFGGLASLGSLCSLLTMNWGRPVILVGLTATVTFCKLFLLFFN